MAILGRLSVILEAKGSNEVIAALKGIEVASANTSRNIRNMNSSLKNGFETNEISAYNKSINQQNKSYLDLIQTLGILSVAQRKFIESGKGVVFQKSNYISNVRNDLKGAIQNIFAKDAFNNYIKAVFENRKAVVPTTFDTKSKINAYDREIEKINELKNALRQSNLELKIFNERKFSKTAGPSLFIPIPKFRSKEFFDALGRGFETLFIDAFEKKLYSTTIREKLGNILSAFTGISDAMRPDHVLRIGFSEGKLTNPKYLKSFVPSEKLIEARKNLNIAEATLLQTQIEQLNAKHQNPDTYDVHKIVNYERRINNATLSVKALRKEVENIEKADKKAFKKETSFFNFKALESNFFSTFMNSMNIASMYHKVVYGSLVPAIIAIGTAAVKSSSEMESMTAKLQAVNVANFTNKGFTNKDEIEKLAKVRTTEVLDMVKGLAIPSSYLVKDLFLAAQEMESFGINAKAALRPAVQISEAFGGGNENLQMITRMMGKMASGNLPDSRAFARFGISRSGFENLMAKEGKGPLETFVNFIEKNYSDVLDRLKPTFDSKSASFMESLSLSLRKIGEPISRMLIKIMDEISKFINQLENSKVLDEIGTMISNSLKTLLDPEFMMQIGEMAVKTIAYMSVVAENMANLTKIFVGLGAVLVELIKPILNAATLFMLSGTKGMQPDFKNLWSGIKLLFDPKLLNAHPAAEFTTAMERAEKMSKKVKSGSNENTTKEFTQSDWEKAMKEGLISDTSKILDAQLENGDKLDKIKDNTKSVADELSLRKAAMGGRGGPLNQLGMSPTQIAFAGNVNMNKSAFQDPSLMNPISMLEKAIVEIVRRNDSKTFRRF